MRPLFLIDFFCGGGGATKGLSDAGIIPVFGFDKDEKCAETYNENNRTASFYHKDFHEPVPGPYGDLLWDTYGTFAGDERLTGNDFIFFGSPPCQPFSSLNTRRKDDRDSKLVWAFLDYVRLIQPAYVLIENVSGIKYTIERIVPRVIERLKAFGYAVSHGMVKSCDYGVPQVRKRYFILASLHGRVPFPKQTHSAKSGQSSLFVGDVKPYVTVRDTISKYPPCHPNAVEIPVKLENLDVRNHLASAIIDDNIKRYQNTPGDGGSMRDWPQWLKDESGYDGRHIFDDAYGRLRWDRPASTISTDFTSPGSGRVGHPEQDRAISIREGAALQTFPDDYVFYDNITAQKAMIGNAVPPVLAAAFGREIMKHYERGW